MQITSCKYCGSNNLTIEKTPELIHYGKIVCNHCKRFLAWKTNPEREQRNTNRANKKTVKQVCEFHGFTKEFCFFCLRTRELLGKSETLTIDHIEELDFGGNDVIENMQVLCSACHKLKNWTRLYMNWHLNGKGEDDNNTREG